MPRWIPKLSLENWYEFCALTPSDYHHFIAWGQANVQAWGGGGVSALCCQQFWGVERKKIIGKKKRTKEKNDDEKLISSVCFIKLQVLWRLFYTQLFQPCAIIAICTCPPSKVCVPFSPSPQRNYFPMVFLTSLGKSLRSISCFDNILIIISFVRTNLSRAPDKASHIHMRERKEKVLARLRDKMSWEFPWANCNEV